jgi:uncharacterized membrane protein
MLENICWGAGGFIICIIVLLIAMLIQTWIEECGRKKLERLVNEFTNREQEVEEHFEKDIRDKLAAQKEQIETKERKAREYQAARFNEERELISKEWYEKGITKGKSDTLAMLKAQVNAGQIIIKKGE